MEFKMKKLMATVMLSGAFATSAFAAEDATDLNAVFNMDSVNNAAQVEVLSQEEMQSTEGAFLLHYLFGSLFSYHHHSYYGHHGYQYNPCGC
jgi:hypothetical protein